VQEKKQASPELVYGSAMASALGMVDDLRNMTATMAIMAVRIMVTRYRVI
jgi:hypothetical protein